MQKRGKIIASVLILVIIMMGCRAENVLGEISKTIGVNATAGEIISESDSHGGFHGDGTTIIEVKYKDADLAEQIEAHEDWNMLPLTENLTALIYGVHTEESSVGPMVHDGNNTPIVPEVHNGYYYFFDRHSQSRNPKDDSGVIGRGSYNFTMAIYDVDNQTLYYIEFDT